MTPSRMDPIVFDLYDGAYGPTLRIDVHTTPQALVVNETLRRLASKPGVKIPVHESDSYSLSGVELVSLESTEAEPVGSRIQRPQSATLQWAMGQDEWRRCLALAEHLFDLERPGHQYLTTQGRDDVVVELAYRESRG